MKKFIQKFLSDLHENGGWKALLFHSSWSLTLTSGLSYGFGMLRDMIFSAKFGASSIVDVYNASFVLPEMLLNVLVANALSVAFVPIFSKQYDEDKEKGYQYARQFMSWSLLVLLVVGIGAAIFLPYLAPLLVEFEGEALEQYIRLTRLMLLSPLLFAISNSYGYLLISVKEFLWYGLSPVLYNLGIILGALLFYDQWGMTGLVLGTLLGALLHLMNRFRVLKTKKYKFKNGFDLTFSGQMRETLQLMLPKILQYGMFSFMLLQFTKIASGLPEGSVTIYGFARNFQSLPVSLLGIAIALAAYPSLSHDAAEGNFQKFKKDFRKNRTKSVVYTTLAALALAALAYPMIDLLLGRGSFTPENVRLLANMIAVYALSIPLESLLHIYHRAYYSLHNSTIPSLFHALNIGIMIGVAYFFSGRIGVYAIPIGFTAGLALHLTIIMSIFPWLLKKKEWHFKKEGSLS